jgi:hypothetical protein
VPRQERLAFDDGRALFFEDLGALALLLRLQILDRVLEGLLLLLGELGRLGMPLGVRYRLLEHVGAQAE